MKTLSEQHSGQPGWRQFLLVMAITTVVMVPATALAQSDTEEDSFAVIEEVIVTATRREESLMDVSIAVTAISGQELQDFGVLDITYISQMSPNTTLKVSRGTNTTLTAFIRGVGQQDPVAGFESGVGLYLDDVYLNRPQAAVLDIYDVERIEVLRGPQGTLYGRNTIGGAIKYVTKRLKTDGPEARVKVSYGTDNLFDIVLTGSAPMSDTFRIGGSFARFTRDGFGDNLNISGVENYNKDSLGARLSAEWEPSDNWFIKLAADYVQDDSDPRQGHRLTVGNISGAPVLDNVYDTRAVFPCWPSGGSAIQSHSRTFSPAARTKVGRRSILTACHRLIWMCRRLIRTNNFPRNSSFCFQESAGRVWPDFITWMPMRSPSLMSSSLISVL